MARRFVVEQVENPYSAVYPDYEASRSRVEYQGDCRFKVSGIVTVEAKTGSKADRPFSGEVRYLPDSGEWENLSIKLIDE